MKGRIALIGGDEFTPPCRQLDNELLQATGKVHPKVLIVPTAAAAQRPALAAQHGVQQFEMLGAVAAPLMVVNAEDAENEAFVSEIDAADVVYFAGGNPAHLLDVLEGSLLLQKILEGLERGLVLAGSSAGAMVLGEKMRFRQWRSALGIVPGIVTLPHHERSSRNQTLRDVRHETSGELLVLGIDGATACISEGEGWRVAGAGSVTVYKHGDWESFKSGDFFEVR